jgi:hypothetical protein
MSPLSEDSAVCRLAESLGLSLTRRDGIEITDEAAIKAAGLTREVPDYKRIRKLLMDGGTVPGATMGRVQFILGRAL